jgi:FkbM family methyltransferase
MIKETIIKLFSFLPQRILYLGEVFFSSCQGEGYAQNINLEIAACLKLVKKKLETVLDIGAHHGIYTSKLMQNYPKAKYYLFEPCYANVSFLKKKFRNKHNVKIFNFALSSKNKKVILYSPANTSLLASIVKRDWRHHKVYFKIKEKVLIKRFDSIYKKNYFNLIDYCKIDTEGHELEILKGFGKFIKKIKLIQFEFSDANIDSRVFFKDLYYFFKSKNFDIYRISSSGPKIITNYKETDEYFRVTNFIALNKQYN